MSYLSRADEIWVSHYAIKHSAHVSWQRFIANRKMGVRDQKVSPTLVGRPCLLPSNLLAVLESYNSFNSWQRPRSRDQEGGGMIINWSSPSSQAVTHLVSAIYNPNTTTCALMRLVRQGQMITDFEELSTKCFWPDWYSPAGLGAHIRDTKRQFIMRLLHILPPLSAISNLDA